MNELSTIQELCVWILPVLFAVTVHEASHGYMAYWLGDQTARQQGRLTLNPIKHIDLIGTLLVPLSCYFLGGFIFGWAKPVPVNNQFFKNPKRDFALVAMAGPGSNFLMALLWASIAKLGEHLFYQKVPGADFLMLSGTAGINVNLVLMLINLIPIPPLDGSRILSHFLPSRIQPYFDAIEPYGFMILILLMSLNVLSLVINPFYLILQRFIISLFNF